MFNSFNVTSKPGTEPGYPTEQVPPNSHPSSRTKRQQVSRACIWCRTYRVKCDANYPCRNCQIKGRKCSDETGQHDVRTFPSAIKEIERLQKRVKDLERQIKRRSDDQDEKISERPKRLLSPNLDPLDQHGGNKSYYNWDFISTPNDPSNRQCYGHSSRFYFTEQMTSYLGLVLPQQESDMELTPTSMSAMSFSPEIPTNPYKAREFSNWRHIHLSRSKEEQLLAKFWLTFRWRLPDLDEAAFGTHYTSVWQGQSLVRNMSPFVDIILALSIQHNSSLGTDYDKIEVGIPDHLFYRRCQSLLADELEGPSIQTFHCYFLSATWLYNASYLNMAHNMLAISIRSGVILGLHLEPPSVLPPEERLLRKRLWWLTYTFEMKMSIELGRPLAVNFSQVSCGIPLSPSTVASPDATAFHTYAIKLTLAIRAIYITFYRQCASALRTSGNRTLHQDSSVLETCAVFLQSKTTYLQTWLQRLPPCFKTPRTNHGQPFSTDRSTLVILPSTPSWLIQQRISLELNYHDYSMSLHRPFISFNGLHHARLATSTPVTDTNALICLNHAITTTSILHHLLSETTILAGWHESTPWLWNATLCMIGYIIAHPDRECTLIARQALTTAMSTFSILSPNFSSASRAEKIAAELAARADVLIARTNEPIEHNDLDHGSQDTLLRFPPTPGFDYNQYHLDDFTDSVMFQDTRTAASTNFTFMFDSIGDFTDDGNLFDLLDFGDLNDLDHLSGEMDI
ncbi:hypothetical protein B0J11DRAFT_139575 [Dendryphion nanum]|uniref:Zn(2)-C6 fungal-type domain-containing protein n=1 Tax=Dendryphion nanum TaxID=256645 RepID=A0A9P9D7G0_9PLEO|nr:hypothetical protein B0J11DRAFT_139575 [Dendryphion nanum]